jgi:hypothetical protein
VKRFLLMLGFAAIWSCALGATGAPTVQAPGSLTASEVSDALLTAESGRPMAYSLTWRRSTSRTAATVGQVFTPWLRVVCFARAQLAAGRAIDVDSLPSELLQPIILVGFYATPPAQTAADGDVTVQAVPHAANDRSRGQAALWTRVDQSVPCGEPQERSFAVLAAFRRDVITQGTDILVRRGTPRRFFAVRGTVGAEDVAVWK